MSQSHGMMTVGLAWILMAVVLRVLPSGAVRGGFWSLRRWSLGIDQADDAEREFHHWFTRTLFPAWLVCGAVLVVAGLFVKQ